MIACSIYDIHIVAKKICGVSLQANLKVPKIPLVDYVTEFYGGLVGLKQKISHNVGRAWSRRRKKQGKEPNKLHRKLYVKCRRPTAQDSG